MHICTIRYQLSRQFFGYEGRASEEKNLTLLGYYAASSANFLPTFRDNPSVLSSGFKNPKESL